MRADIQGTRMAEGAIPSLSGHPVCPMRAAGGSHGADSGQEQQRFHRPCRGRAGGHFFTIFRTEAGIQPTVQ